MKIAGNLNLQGNQLMQARLEMETGFPSAPQPGRLLFREEDRTFYICASIEDDLPIWIPCGRIRSMYRHTQGEAALEWTIQHNLNLSPVMVQVYDAAGNWIIPDKIISQDANTVTVRFAQAALGQAIILRGDFDGMQNAGQVYEQAFTGQTVVSVTHGLGYNPDIKVYVDNFQVQPQSIVHESTSVATVTFNAPTTGLIIAA